MADAAPLLAAAALLLVPGSLLLFVLGEKRALAWTMAPSLTVLMAAALGAVYPYLSIRWEPVTALVGALVVMGAAGLTRRLTTATPQDEAPTAIDGGSIGVVDAVVGLGFLVVLTVRKLTVVPAMGGLDAVNNAYDAFFHASLVAHIRETGDASILTGSAPMYSGSVQPYPLVFDALAALLPWDTAISVNALMLVLVPIGFLTVAGLLHSVVRPGVRGPFRALVVLAGACTVLVFRSPDALGLSLGLWPNLLALSLAPSALAAVLVFGRGVRQLTGGKRIVQAVLLSAVVAGVVCAHPSMLFSLLIVGMGAAAATVLLAGSGSLARRTGWVAAVLLAVAAVGFVGMNVGLRGMDVTGRPTGGAVGLALDVLSDRPRIGILGREFLVMLPWWAIALLGTIVAWRRRSLTGLTAALSLGLTAALIVLGSSLIPVLGDLTNVWYGAPERLMPVIGFSCAVLVVGALAAGADSHYWGLRRATVLLGAVGAIAALTVNVLPSRAPTMASIFDADRQGRHATYVSAEEQQFIEDASAELDESAVVLGDPLDGTVAFWIVGGVDVVYPSLASPGILDTRRVGLYADQAWSDPPVCMSMKRLGITHLYRDYSDTSGRYFAQSKTTDHFVGIAQIPTEDLEVVASAGPYTLYELDPPC